MIMALEGDRDRSSLHSGLRFAAFSALVFVFVFAVTWLALAQAGPETAEQATADAAPEIELNLDVLDNLRKAGAQGGELEKVPEASPVRKPGPVTETKSSAAVAPRDQLTVASPSLAPPLPVANETDGNLPPPVIPAQPPATAERNATPRGQTVANNAPALSDPASMQFRLLFEPGSPALTLEGAEGLSSLALALKGNAVRLELHAYAGSPDSLSSDNRRLSLKRALAVRGYLVDQAIDARRIDLHAEGSAPDGDPPDRVDIRLKNP